MVLVVACLLALRKRWKDLGGVIAGFGVLLTLVVLVTPVGPKDLFNIAEYQNQFYAPGKWGQGTVAVDLLPRFIQGTSEYLTKYVRDAMIPFIGGPTTFRVLDRFGLTPLLPLVSATVVVLVIVGFIVSLKRVGLHPLHIFIPIYMGILTVWPWKGERFLYAIFPFLFGYLLISIDAVLDYMTEHISWLGTTHKRILLSGATFLLLWIQIVASVRIDDSLNHVRDFRTGTSWLRGNAPADAVILAEQPQSIYLYSGRATIELPAEFADVRAMACKYKAYALLAPVLEWTNDRIYRYDEKTIELRSALTTNTISGQLVFSDEAEKVEIYQIHCDQLRTGGQSMAIGATPAILALHTLPKNTRDTLSFHSVCFSSSSRDGSE